MRRIVLIDGENLRHAIEKLLSNGGIAFSQTDIENFDYRGLIEELLADNFPSEVLWFGAKLRLYKNNPFIEQKTKDTIKSQSIFVNNLQRQNIDFIKVGYLRARESSPCRSCKNREWVLTEKGVDVGLAVRIITEASKANTEIVVISADTDLLPAFHEAKKLGAKIMHVGYEFRPINALVKASDATRTISVPMASKYKK